MDKLLNKVFPLLQFYFGKEGLSATLANARKNENTNENNHLTKDLQSAELYETHLTLVSDRGTQTNQVSVRKLKPADFDILNSVAKNNAENALLGNGIKIFNKALETIRSLSALELTEKNGGDVSLPVVHLLEPRKTAVVGATVDNVLQLERVEEIMGFCSTEVLEQLDAATVKNALRLESEAATLGLELTKKDSFLQRIISAEQELQPIETVANFAMVIKQPKLAYTGQEVEEFKKLFQNLQKRYLNIQGQLNGIKKNIKDTIRLTDVQFAKDYEARLAIHQSAQNAYSEKLNRINAQGEVLRQQLIQELLTLKIQTA